MNMKKNRVLEIVRFLVTGLICFAIEFVVLVLLKELTDIDTLIATPIAFLISVTANYLLCVVWVFEKSVKGNHTTQLGFLMTSAVGLFLNELLMLFFRVLWGEDAVLIDICGLAISMYMINKVLATLIVMIWNYFTKRAMLCHTKGNERKC